MNRITPLLTDRSLAFAHRANVRPVPLSKNERSFFFQLMSVFPLHGNDKELNERIAQWISVIPPAFKQSRHMVEALSRYASEASCSKNDVKAVGDAGCWVTVKTCHHDVF